MALSAMLAAGCATAGEDQAADAAIGGSPDARRGFPDASFPTIDAGPRPDAAVLPPDAAPGTPDAAPTTPDAAPGAPDAGCTVQVIQLLANANLDSGPGGGWVETGGFDIVLSQASSPDPFPFAPDTAAYAAWLGGVTDSVQGLYQDVAIPAGATNVTLTWKQVIGTQEILGLAYDYFTVGLLDPGSGGVLEVILQQTNLDAGTTTVWSSMSRPITGSYAGQTVRLLWESSNDISDPSNFFVDTIALNVTVCQ